MKNREINDLIEVIELIRDLNDGKHCKIVDCLLTSIVIYLKDEIKT